MGPSRGGTSWVQAVVTAFCSATGKQENVIEKIRNLALHRGGIMKESEGEEATNFWANGDAR